MGDGTLQDRRDVVTVLDDVKAIAAGSAHTVFLRQDGTVWATGLNDVGQLGDGTTQNRSTPVQVLSMSNIEAISCGSHHTMFLRNDGSAFTVGDNYYGQLGDGSQYGFGRSSPTFVLSNVKAISAGAQHSVFLRRDDTAWATGWNSAGQLGDGTRQDKIAPVKILPLVRGISAVEQHTFFLRSDGTTFAAGQNIYGQLGGAAGSFVTLPVRVLVWHFSLSTTTTTTATTYTTTNSSDETSDDLGFAGQTSGTIEQEESSSNPFDSLTAEEQTYVVAIVVVAMIWLCAICACCVACYCRCTRKIKSGTAVRPEDDQQGLRDAGASTSDRRARHLENILSLPPAASTVRVSPVNPDKNALAPGELTNAFKWFGPGVAGPGYDPASANVVAHEQWQHMQSQQTDIEQTQLVEQVQ